VQTLTEEAVQEAPVLEQIECLSCGVAMLDGKCLTPECDVAAAQAIPRGSLLPNGLAAPFAFTISGSVD
jgi:hypothetical protein